MSSYELHQNLECRVLCASVFESMCVFCTYDSLVYYSETTKFLPWFNSEDLTPLYTAINGAFVSILTKDGTLLIFPLYTIIGDQFLPAWRKFMSKSYFNLLNSCKEESILDVLGTCLATRDRAFENHLEVTVIKVKSPFFSGMVWSSNYLIISTKTEFLLINTFTGALDIKVQAKTEIDQITLIDTNILIRFENTYTMMTIQDIINDKVQGQKAMWEGTICPLPMNFLICVLSKEKLEVFVPEQILCPSSSFFLPMQFGSCAIWGKSIVGIGPGVAVVGKVPANHQKRLNKALGTEKVCLCGKCFCRDVNIEYDDWIRKDKESSVLWRSEEDIGNVRLR